MPPKCNCKSEVTNFSSVACIGDDYYKCRKSNGEDVPFSADNCHWVSLNVMGCDEIYTKPVQTTPPPPQCSCEAEVSNFSDVRCIGLNYYVCKRNDGKDAKFEASNCDWVKSNKMGCAQTCSCAAETSKFADVKCIGPDQYMCIREDGQQAKVSTRQLN